MKGLTVKYIDFLNLQSMTKTQLLAHAQSNLVDDPPMDFEVLPTPPMLMLDRITEVFHAGNTGRIVAEQHVAVDAWYFYCHFRRDPIQPGCLGIDAVWQLLGLYMTLRGALGSGRALGCKIVDFFGQIRPYTKVVRYEVEVERYLESKETRTAVIVGAAKVFADDQHVYTIGRATAGTFMNIRYCDFPHASANSFGGRIHE